jgi:hypothetical protein
VTEDVDARLVVAVEAQPGPYGVAKVQARLENVTAWTAPGATRHDAVRRSLVGAHLLLAASAGRFLSLADPPEWARSYAAGCDNVGLWPVPVDAAATVVLASPIILEDHPQVAPESHGDMYDATEIDEILSLRTLALSDAEKAEARATDPRAASVIDRVESMGPADWERLHGAVREGSRVRLAPGRGGDAQDIFLDGRTAVVERVLVDVDGTTHLAVTVDDDPGADLRRSQGRFFYFRTDEVEPL